MGGSASSISSSTDFFSLLNFFTFCSLIKFFSSFSISFIFFFSAAFLLRVSIPFALAFASASSCFSVITLPFLRVCLGLTTGNTLGANISSWDIFSFFTGSTTISSSDKSNSSDSSSSSGSSTGSSIGSSIGSSTGSGSGGGITTSAR